MRIDESIQQGRARIEGRARAVLLALGTLAPGLGLPVEPAGAQVVVGEGTDARVTVSGFVRFRGTGAANFDVDDGASPEARADRSLSSYDLRAWLAVNAQRGGWSGNFALDVAGDDFSDGTILGNENPALLRETEVRLRHLWVQYDGRVHARLGRQPGRIGGGWVSHVNRDALRLWGDLGTATANLIVIKGAEVLTAAPGDAQPDVPNPPSHDDDLDAVVIAVSAPIHGLTVALSGVTHIDSSPTDRFPEKRFVDLRVAGGSPGGRAQWSVEGAWMGGRTPRPTGGAARDNRAWLWVGDLLIPRGDWGVGLSVGRGSGDDDPTDDIQGNFQNLFQDETGPRYTNVFADDVHGWDGTAGSLARGSGLANVTFVQPRVTWAVAEGWSADVSGTLLRATEPRVVGTGPLGDRVPTGTATSSDLGWELDLDVARALGPGTRAFLSAGWFEPGDLYGPGAGRVWKTEVGVEVTF